MFLAEQTKDVCLFFFIIIFEIPVNQKLFRGLCFMSVRFLFGFTNADRGGELKLLNIMIK